MSRIPRPLCDNLRPLPTIFADPGQIFIFGRNRRKWPGEIPDCHRGTSRGWDLPQGDPNDSQWRGYDCNWFSEEKERKLKVLKKSKIWRYRYFTKNGPRKSVAGRNFCPKILFEIEPTIFLSDAPWFVSVSYLQIRDISILWNSRPAVQGYLFIFVPIIQNTVILCPHFNSIILRTVNFLYISARFFNMCLHNLLNLLLDCAPKLRKLRSTIFRSWC